MNLILQSLSRLLLLTLLLQSTAAFADAVVDARSYDGTGNNLANSHWGSSESAMPRLGPAYYPGDGSGATFYGGPNSFTLPPNPREISNHLYDTNDKYFANSRGLSNMVWQWGQFLDHDITQVHTSSSPDDWAPIYTSPNDEMAPFIPFQRSNYAAGTGTDSSNPRQQMNSITSYIDASNVYGSDHSRAMALRDIGNAGRMKTSAGDMLPYNTLGLPNDDGDDPTSFFVAGDTRANEQTGLLTMHTLFVREHNRLAGLLADQNPNWNDEELYQTARKIVGAQMQSITYKEFLPALLGRRNTRQLAPGRYAYDDTIDPSIKNEFAGSLYRFGHSMLPEELTLAEIPGEEQGSISMLESFFNPSLVAGDATGDTQVMDQLLLGLSTTMAQEIDPRLADGVRNFLFGLPGSGGMDLAALNIQRGRDHGLPTYNDLRIAYGLDPVNTFREITRNRRVRRKLRQLYGTVHNIDAWVGGLAEDHIPGGSVGELIYTAIADQFTELRDGDRYFYAGDEELMENESVQSVIDLSDVSLADIISWNTSLEEIPDNVFVVRRSPHDALADGFANMMDNIHDMLESPDDPFGGNSQLPLITTNIPEPSTCWLALAGGLVLVRRRCRRQ